MGLGRTSADGGDVSPKLGRKSKLTQSPLKSEAHAVPLCQRWVVHPSKSRSSNCCRDRSKTLQQQ